MSSSSDHQEYDENFVGALEVIWGEGYLSPGGKEEVVLVVGDQDLQNKTILDIGCGSGGIDKLLVNHFQAKHVTGIDIDPSLIDRCKKRLSETEKSKIDYIFVQPGKLPFEDNSFDVVFTKDSLIHIQDKVSICEEVIRVLKAGGKFIASDWLKDIGPMTPEMQHYVDLEDLGFGMGNIEEYRSALEISGFKDIDFVDRNKWYCHLAKEELEKLSGVLYDQLIEAAGQELGDQQIKIWKAMVVALEQGQLRPTHWCASKPKD